MLACGICYTHAQGLGANAVWVLLEDSLAGAIFALSFIRTLLWSEMSQIRVLLAAWSAAEQS